MKRETMYHSRFPIRNLRGMGDIPLSWDAALAQWKTAVADFTNAYNEFLGNQTQAAQDASTWATWQDLNNQAQTAQSGITNIAGKLQAAGVAVGNFVDSSGAIVANALESFAASPGASAISAGSIQMMGVRKQVMAGLAQAQLLVYPIAIATIVGAVAYLANVIANLLKFNQVMAAARSSGASPTDTASLLNAAGIAGTSFFTGGNLPLMLLLAGGAILFLPKLIKGKS